MKTHARDAATLSVWDGNTPVSPDGFPGLEAQRRDGMGVDTAGIDTSRAPFATDAPIDVNLRDMAAGDIPAQDTVDREDEGRGGSDSGRSDAGGEQFPGVCTGAPDHSTGSCECQPNPDFLGARAGDTCASRATGAACTRECCGSCGLVSNQGPLGSLRRACVNGAYAGESCTPPLGWRKPLVGGACSPPMEMGTSATFTSSRAQGLPCNSEWGVCFTRGDSQHGRERGCACLFDPSVGSLRFACGEVRGWFFDNGQDWAFMSGLIWRSGDF